MTTWDDFVPARRENALWLALLVVVVAMVVPLVPLALPAPMPLDPKPPVVEVRATPAVHFAPFVLDVQVRQQPDAVAGREVCVYLRGDDENGGQRSCWQEDKPSVLVDRQFRVKTAGAYEVFAIVAGTPQQMSNKVAIRAVDGQAAAQDMLMFSAAAAVMAAMQ